MSDTSKQRIHRFQKNLRTWWRTNRRDLPWRKTHDPYRILVSEIMLQQTQVDRVIPKYRAFLRQFPTVHALAHAPRADIIRVWSGLGYNRRAVNLHRSAQIIETHYKGRTPLVVEELKKLPGVGEYTARAVAAFAVDACVAPVDTNIKRILIRHFGIGENKVVDLAQSLVPAKKAGDWSHMLMDFGALVCTSRNPQCGRLRLPHVAEAPPPRPQKSFQNSNRFWRGRIVHILQAHRCSLTQERLYSQLQKLHRMPLSKKRMTKIVRALEKDGLLKKGRASFIALA